MEPEAEFLDPPFDDESRSNDAEESDSVTYVPALVGVPVERTRLILAMAGLTTRETEIVTKNYMTGSVLRQSPVAGALLKRGGLVNVWVAIG